MSIQRRQYFFSKKGVQRKTQKNTALFPFAGSQKDPAFRVLSSISLSLGVTSCVPKSGFSILLKPGFTECNGNNTMISLSLYQFEDDASALFQDLAGQRVAGIGCPKKVEIQNVNSID